MPWVFALVILGLAVVVLSSWAAGSLPSQNRAKFSRTMLVIGVAFVLLLLARVGMPWIAAVGAALLTAFRFLWPVAIRVLPWLVSARLGQTKRQTTGRSEQRAHATPPMSRRDAFEVLGLSENANEDQIRQAYTALIKKVHPDRGGSAYLAARVNLARDVLLPREGR